MQIQSWLLPFFLLCSAAHATSPSEQCAQGLKEHSLASIANAPTRGFATDTLPEVGEKAERRMFEMLRRLIPLTGYQAAPAGTITHILAPACGAFGEARALNYAFGSGTFGEIDPQVQLMGFDIYPPVMVAAVEHFRTDASELPLESAVMPPYLTLMIADARKIAENQAAPTQVDVGWIRHPDSRYDYVPVPGYPKLLKPMFRDVFARLRPGGILILTHVAASEQRHMAKILIDLKLPGTVRTFKSDWGEPIFGQPGLKWDNYITIIVRTP